MFPTCAHRSVTRTGVAKLAVNVSGQMAFAW
jgi:hypothetical protein